MQHSPNHPASPLAFEPQPDVGQYGELPLSNDARDALLARLEAWIDEEEHLVAEIERRIGAAVGAVLYLPPRPGPEPSANGAAQQAPASPPASDGPRCAEKPAASIDANDSRLADPQRRADVA